MFHVYLCLVSDTDQQTCTHFFTLRRHAQRVTLRRFCKRGGNEEEMHAALLYEVNIVFKALLVSDLDLYNHSD